MMTLIRVFATAIGYMTIFLWALGTLNAGNFIYSFTTK